MKTMDIGKKLCVVNNSLRRNLENQPEFKELAGISGKNGWIIGYLHDHKDRSIYQRDLEKEFNITRSTASKVLILMEKKGLIERHGIEGDARLKQITLTQRAEELKFSMHSSGQRVEEKLISGFNHTEIETLKKYLDRMIENLK